MQWVGMDPTVSNTGTVSKPRSCSPFQLSLTLEGLARAELVQEGRVGKSSSLPHLPKVQVVRFILLLGVNFCGTTELLGLCKAESAFRGKLSECVKGCGMFMNNEH